MRRLKSLWIIVVIFVQKIVDQTYRMVVGVPTLKRSQVTANLFLGGQYNLRGLSRLKAIGITGIINMRMHSIYTEIQYQGFHYLHLPTPDNTAPKLDDLIKGADFAHEEIRNNGKVYIHCRQGLGRGPSMAIAYLMKIGTTYDDALAAVKKVRTFIDPTAVQIARLKELETYYKKNALPVGETIRT